MVAPFGMPFGPGRGPGGPYTWGFGGPFPYEQGDGYLPLGFDADIHYAAFNIDGSYNTSLNHLDSIEDWVNLGTLGSACDLQQLLAGKKPTYYESGLNGMPYAYFDNGDEIKFSGLSPAITPPYFYAALWTRDAGASARWVFGCANDPASLYFTGGSGLFSMWTGGGSSITIGANQDNYNSGQFWFDTTSSNFRYNGSDNAGTMANQNITSFSLGGGHSGGFGFHHGRIVELIIVDGTDESAAAEQYFKDQYGQSSFPVST